MSLYLRTRAADADIDEIWRYVSANRDNIRSDALEDEMHATMQRVGEIPGIGHLRDDLADEPLRFFGLHKFLIVFRPDTGPVQRVRVLHGASDVQAILASDPGVPLAAQ